VLIQKLHHIAYVVHDLDEALPLFTDRFGLHVEVREQMPEQQVEALMLATDAGRIELIAPTTPDSGVRRFLDSRGPGLHHVAYEVDDLQEALRSLADQGLELIDSAPRRGLGGHWVAFVHPQSASGALTELVQSHPDH
jgi:methylmalonyl-CoA/ethylmalonyl-CoA epimerase